MTHKNATPLRNFRLKDSTMEDIERLRVLYDLRSGADVIRFLVSQAVRREKLGKQPEGQEA